MISLRKLFVYHWPNNKIHVWIVCFFEWGENGYFSLRVLQPGWGFMVQHFVAPYSHSFTGESVNSQLPTSETGLNLRESSLSQKTALSSRCRDRKTNNIKCLVQGITINFILVQKSILWLLSTLHSYGTRVIIGITKTAMIFDSIYKHNFWVTKCRNKI